MYYDYFGFKQPPFKITPDTSLFYPGGDRGAILDALLYAVLNGEGIIKVVGEVGSGKTMLCRMLEKELPDKVEVVYLVNPSISPENTLHAIAFELKLGIKSTTSRFEVMNELQQYLLQRHSQNRQVVVFVEEAQSMPIATLEEIRLLSNLETQQSKLLQIVLFGQPELDEMIALPEIRQLKERITYSFQLSPFKINDIREYINSRVRACGYRSGDLFSDAAIKQIEYYSKGLLRRINILADKSLLAAFADNSHTVSIKHTRMAARDSEFLPRSFWSARAILVAGWATLLLVVVVAYVLLPERTSRFAPAEQVSVTTSINTPAVSDVGPEIIPPDTQSGLTTTITPPVQQETVISLPEERIEQPAIDSLTLPTVSNDTAQADSGAVVTQVPVIPEQAAADNVIVETPVMAEPINTTNITNDGPITVPTEVPNEIQELEGVKGNTSELDEIRDISAPVNSPQRTQNSPENQLLGMAPIYQLHDFGDNGLTPDETTDLQNRLIKLPPESAEYQFPATEPEACQRCWSIIYRPVPVVKNL